MVAYNLTLFDDNGIQTEGRLEYEILRNNINSEGLAEELIFSGKDRTTLEVARLRGKVILPGLIDDEKEVNGVLYISALGPPVTSILTAITEGQGVGIQFNSFDLPGSFIAGGINYKNQKYFCFSGVRKI